MAIESIMSLFNAESLEETKKGKIKMISPDEIIESSLNIFSQEDIEDLKDNILENGLFTPIVVNEQNGYYKILSGHRRFKAIKLIIESGNSYSFMGRDLGKIVPCLISGKHDLSPTEERLMLLSANSHRNPDPKEKKLIVKEASDLYDELKEDGKKPKGRKREWISRQTGFSSSSVSSYLPDDEDYVSLDKPAKEKETSGFEKAQKKIASLKKYLDTISLELKEDEKGQLIESIKDIVTIFN